MWLSIWNQTHDSTALSESTRESHWCERPALAGFVFDESFVLFARLESPFFGRGWLSHKLKVELLQCYQRDDCGHLYGRSHILISPRVYIADSLHSLRVALISLPTIVSGHV